MFAPLRFPSSPETWLSFVKAGYSFSGILLEQMAEMAFEAVVLKTTQNRAFALFASVNYAHTQNVWMWGSVYEGEYIWKHFVIRQKVFSLN